MEIFLVIQTGVYRHGIFGIFSTVEKAIHVADDLAYFDEDDRHEYQVIPLVVDEQVPRYRKKANGIYYAASYERHPVYTTKKYLIE